MLTIISQNATVIIAILVALTFVLTTWIIFTEIRLRRFMRGKNGGSLESAINTTLKQNEDLQNAHAKTQQTLSHLNARLRSAARGIATVRFNAFGGRGESGAQSFATAIVSEDGEGVVVSSMHAREQTRVFAKQLKGFDSEYELTEEEMNAVKNAHKKVEGTA